MMEPEDYGLSEVQTFAHIADPAPAPDHSVFWKHWFSRLVTRTPVLRRRTSADDSDPGATHEFISDRDVPIGCVLVTPGGGRPVRAALVAVHGYATPPALKDAARRWRSIADSGVAVLVVRLRGYPGSRLGIGDQTTLDELGAGWIGRGFAGASHDEWIVPQAAADVCNACRVMRNLLLGRDTDPATGSLVGVDPGVDRPGVFLTGTSLGGGLATISAAQLIGKLSGESIVERLAIALPSLGAWGWKLAHRHSGTTIEIDRVLRRHPQRREELVNRLRLCDAAIHAKRVGVPTLGMLARRDDVAPAPGAAAVFNAIEAEPGRKWRFVVPYGHFEGGTANARRHALFERVLADFFDPARSPVDSMGAWEPYLHNGAGLRRADAPAGADPRTPDRELYDGIQK